MVDNSRGGYMDLKEFIKGCPARAYHKPHHDDDYHIYYCGIGYATYGMLRPLCPPEDLKDCFGYYWRNHDRQRQV
jgi:hypothetical protein